MQRRPKHVPRTKARRDGEPLVPVERVCVDQRMYEAMTNIASRAMADTEVAQRLVWGDE